jgi:hypothetical protein
MTSATPLQASDLTLHEVEAKFRLQENRDDEFFPEWREDLFPLSDEEQRSLDKIKKNFLYQSKGDMYEELVKLVILSPLLSMAGFYSPPFRIQPEYPVEIVVKERNEEVPVRGRIDILVLQERLWILVIESKRDQFSLKPAIPQALTYMKKGLESQTSSFGLVTNGSEFRFLKLQRSEVGFPDVSEFIVADYKLPDAYYGFSDLFTLQRRSNELYAVLSILKRLGSCITQASH